MKYYCKNCGSEFKPGNEKLTLPPVNNPSVHCPFCGRTNCEFGIIPDSIFEEIRAERQRQDEKFGEQNHPMRGLSFYKQLYGEYLQFPPDSALEKTLEAYKERNGSDKKGWYDILIEEICEAFLETKPEKQREEMIQVAAVAVEIIEYLDRGKG